MLVTIAGCGALGSIFASKLLDGGFDVQVFQRRGATFDALRKGLVIESEDQSRSKTYYFRTVSDTARQLEPCKLVIVLVKSFSTPEVGPLMDILADDGVILTLQNGLGNAEILSSLFGDERVGAGAAHWGAIKSAPGVVREAGGAFIALGPWKNGVSMHWVADVLEEAAFTVRYVDDPRPFIWKKLTINAMVNTTAALTGLNNEGIMANPVLLELMKNIGTETVKAAGRAGVRINMDELWTEFVENIRKTATNIPSMLQDNLAGRKMEVDTIPGGVLKYAGYQGEFPYTETVYALLKAINSSRGY